MYDDRDQTKPAAAEFDFSAFPDNTLFHERRTGGRDRRRTDTPQHTVEPAPPPAAADQRRAKKERRRRIDPTTFEKQYTADEMEFMNAMQRFKEASGKSFPTHGEVIKVAIALGYRRVIDDPEPEWDDTTDNGECLADATTVDALAESLPAPISTGTVPL